MLCGKKGVGKSHASEVIERELSGNGYGVTILSFATLLKKVFVDICKLFQKKFVGEDGVKEEITETLLLDRDKKEVLRPFLQTIGTEIIRKYMGENIWSELVVKQIENIVSEHARENIKLVFIIDDARYQNEIETVKKTFGDLVTSLELVKMNDETEIVVDTHSSETQVLETDYVYATDKPSEIFERDMIQFIHDIVMDV